MTTIYHNPRCGKSRQGLAIVESSGHPYNVVLYLKEPLLFDEIKTILTQLDILPLDLVRKGEAVWKASFKGKVLTDTETIQAMVDHPILIERPIVVHGTKAVIGRPPENIELFLKK
jgi:arsenate reductase